MINPEYAPIVSRAQNILDLNCPSPESDIIWLCKIFSNSPETKVFSTCARLVFEISDIISQSRWHLGQSILLAEIYPDKLRFEPEEDNLVSYPYHLLLPLREYFDRPEKVLCVDYSEGKSGNNSYATWIYHMMIDNSIIRSIAALDRLAQVLCLVADEKFEKYYFRSKKLKKVHEKVNLPETKQLLDLTEKELYNKLILRYRDELNHTRRELGIMAKSVPVESYLNADGSRVIEDRHIWSEEELFSLANAAYHFLLDALKHTAAACDKLVNRN